MTPDELRDAMAGKGLGTPATRAAIIEGLLGERYLLRLEQVPAPVAAKFHQFAGQIRLWVDKLDRNLAQQMQLRAQRAEAEAAAQARAEARALKAAEQKRIQMETLVEQDLKAVRDYHRKREQKEMDAAGVTLYNLKH